MPRGTKKVVEEAQEEEIEIDDSKAGVVMIDDTYYFKITNRQYVFGKKSIIKDESSPRCGETVMKDMLYPSSITGVFRLYFKELLVNRTAGKTLDIKQLIDIVDSIKADVEAIRKRIESI